MAYGSMKEPSRPLLVGVVLGASAFVCGLVTGHGLTLDSTESVHVEEAEHAEEVYEEVVEHAQWRGGIECLHGKMVLYSVGNLVDFEVFPGEAGWMWQLTSEDGGLTFYQQPPRVFCSVINEE